MSGERKLHFLSLISPCQMLFAAFFPLLSSLETHHRSKKKEKPGSFAFHPLQVGPFPFSPMAGIGVGARAPFKESLFDLPQYAKNNSSGHVPKNARGHSKCGLDVFTAANQCLFSNHRVKAVSAALQPWFLANADV